MSPRQLDLGRTWPPKPAWPSAMVSLTTGTSLPCPNSKHLEQSSLPRCQSSGPFSHGTVEPLRPFLQVLGEAHVAHVVGIVRLEGHATAATAHHVLQALARFRHHLLGLETDHQPVSSPPCPSSTDCRDEGRRGRIWTCAT